MAEKIGLASPISQGADSENSTLRSRIAARSSVMEDRHPEALDAEALALAAFREPIRSHSPLYKGDLSEQHFRDTLRGERHLRSSNVFRCATSRQPEGRAAALGYAHELAATLGYRLVPKDHPGRQTLDALAMFAEAAARTFVAGVRAHAQDSDGGADVTLSEAIEILEEARHTQRELAQVIASFDAIVSRLREQRA